MKRFTTSILLCCFVFGIVTTTMAQVYFEDNFDDATASEMKWIPLSGDWQLTNNEYHQLSNSVNSMSIVADDYWDEDWNEYTYEIAASKVGGAEGFLLLFRCLGTLQNRGLSLADHPPRMVNQPRLQYWWNIAGWGNTRSKVESWGGTGTDFTTHTVNTGDWYNIKIVNTPTSYTLYLNDEMVEEVNDSTQNGNGRVGLGTWATMVHYDDVIVYGPDGLTPVDPKGKVATAWGLLKAGR